MRARTAECLARLHVVTEVREVVDVALSSTEASQRAQASQASSRGVQQLQRRWARRYEPSRQRGQELGEGVLAALAAHNTLKVRFIYFRSWVSTLYKSLECFGRWKSLPESLDLYFARFGLETSRSYTLSKAFKREQLFESRRRARPLCARRETRSASLHSGPSPRRRLRGPRSRRNSSSTKRSRSTCTRRRARPPTPVESTWAST